MTLLQPSLLPCPWCGCHVTLTERSHRWYIEGEHAEDCLFNSLEAWEFDKRNDAIRLWNNRRSHPPAGASEAGKLVEQLWSEAKEWRNSKDHEKQWASEALAIWAERFESTLSGVGDANWQPIETAPDKGDLLLYNPAEYNERTGKLRISACVRVGYKGDWPMRPATHWMPLPTPPSADGKGV